MKTFFILAGVAVAIFFGWKAFRWFVYQQKVTTAQKSGFVGPLPPPGT